MFLKTFQKFFSLNKEKAYKELFLNNTKAKKFYELYFKQTSFEKFLDCLVLFAIFFTLLIILLGFLIEPSKKVFFLINIISSAILFIFILDIFREYLNSKNTRDFFKNHWVDITLVTILSLYFLFTIYMGIAKVAKEISSTQKMFKEAKHIRIITNLFRR